MKISSTEEGDERERERASLTSGVKLFDTSVRSRQFSNIIKKGRTSTLQQQIQHLSNKEDFMKKVVKTPKKKSSQNRVFSSE